MTRLAVDYTGSIMDKDYNELASTQGTFTCDLPDRVADVMLARGPLYHNGVQANMRNVAEGLTNLFYYNSEYSDRAARTHACITGYNLIGRMD